MYRKLGSMLFSELITIVLSITSLEVRGVVTSFGIVQCAFSGTISGLSVTLGASHVTRVIFVFYLGVFC